MRYFFIDLPNENVIKALNVRQGGYNISDNYSLDGSVVFIKTNQSLIDNSTNSFNTIFPPALTTEVTFEEAKTRLSSTEFQLEAIF